MLHKTKDITQTSDTDLCDIVTKNHKLEAENVKLREALETILEFEHTEACSYSKTCDCFIGIAAEALGK